MHLTVAGGVLVPVPANLQGRLGVRMFLPAASARVQDVGCRPFSLLFSATCMELFFSPMYARRPRHAQLNMLLAPSPLKGMVATYGAIATLGAAANTGVAGPISPDPNTPLGRSSAFA